MFLKFNKIFHFKDSSAHEAWYAIGLQVLIPFLIAGFGTVGAGALFGHLEHFTLFIEVKEIFILVPAIAGLKGNLEMTLASRFSTQVKYCFINALETRNKIPLCL